MTVEGDARGSLGSAKHRRYHSAGRGRHRRVRQIFEEICDAMQLVPLERFPWCACCPSQGLPKSVQRRENLGERSDVNR